MADYEEHVSKQSLAPNFFYDVIVFLTPTITLLVGVCIGLHHLLLPVLKSGNLKFDAGMTAILIIVLFFCSYEYGRLAETFSHIFVGGPLRKLHDWKIGFTSKDFSMDLTDQVRLLGIPEHLFFGRAKSKWTLFFFAMEYVPDVGADLLKRYAWEKLARSSAFSMLTLFVISIGYRYYAAFTGVQFPPMSFGSISYTLTTLLFYIIWSIDYYKRNCWNNDLLVTVAPVIVSGVQKSGTRILTTESIIS